MADRTTIHAKRTLEALRESAIGRPSFYSRIYVIGAGMQEAHGPSGSNVIMDPSLPLLASGFKGGLETIGWREILLDIPTMEGMPLTISYSIGSYSIDQAIGLFVFDYDAASCYAEIGASAQSREIAEAITGKTRDGLDALVDAHLSLNAGSGMPRLIRARDLEAIQEIPARPIDYGSIPSSIPKRLQ
ncbi:MAG TPA: hypothetical protein VJB12_03100 [Candidatus Nanoarchaeia archaeon]|nr:hypothetical protein [Candidatus Nanoarchaeia archaeon]